MLKKLIWLTTIFWLLTHVSVFAENNALTAQTDIDYSTNTITVSGTVPSNREWVSLYVEGPTNRLEYIGSVRSRNGVYSVSFQLTEPVNGEYTLTFKSESMTAPQTETFLYYLSLTAPVLQIVQNSDRTNYSINLRWTPAAGGDGPITYMVYVDGELRASDISATNYLVDGLTANQEYTFQVVAQDAAGTTAESSELVAATGTDGFSFVQLTAEANTLHALALSGEGISPQSDSAIFRMTYQPDQIELVDFAMQEKGEQLEIGRYNKIEILSFVPGQVDFQVIRPTTLYDMPWNGILTTFQFRFQLDYSGSTEIVLQPM